MTSIPDGSSAGLSRRGLVGGLFLVAAAGVSEMLVPKALERPHVAPDARIVLPTVIGDWTLQPTGEVVMPDQGADDGIYDQVLGRVYESSKAPPVMLLTAYSVRQEGAKRLHRPEICYEAGGFALQNSHPIDLPVGPGLTAPARSLVARRTDRSELVVYWTRIADDFPQDVNVLATVLQQKRLKGLIPDGVLVRMSVSGVEPEASRRAIEAFAMALVRSVDPSTRRLLIGDRLATRIQPVATPPASGGMRLSPLP